MTVTPTPRANRTPEHEAFLRRLGEHLRDMRTDAALAQQDIGDIFGWNRDAVSKLENGVTNMALYDYLMLVAYLREVLPADDPGVRLAARLLRGGKRATLRVVK